MAKNLLKDIAIRNAKAADKVYRLSDGEGLYILIKPNGAKWWRFDYTYSSIRNTLSLGVYPSASLSDARREAEKARSCISNGINPSNKRKEEKTFKNIALESESRRDAGLPITNSFADLTRKWLASIAHLTSVITQVKKTSRLERLAFPVLGDMPIKEIRSSDVLAALKPLIDKMQLETAHRLHAEISSVFAYAIVHDFTDYDPSQPVAKQIPAQKVRHRAAIIDPTLVGQLLRDIGNYQGTFVEHSEYRRYYFSDRERFANYFGLILIYRLKNGDLI
jgi:hypothetical protein